ncbi:hypothetical protein [Arthrobacter globiformis]|uniref:hypothetical protein n=1 Tax=Arthrobacter globiformis TaxID=1665 RepID=UPI002788146C|nr:hypothetical protein [Arthrobacter globiformis]MDQ0863771.1 hypothetical protein [Arthrobacter globiformis]
MNKKGRMPSRDFEADVAVKIALMEPSDIAKLGELLELAVHVSVKPLDQVPSILADLLVGQLSRFMRDVLELSSDHDSVLGWDSSAPGCSNLRSADAAVVVECLLALTSSSASAKPAKIKPGIFYQMKMLLQRLFELVNSVHEEREFSDFGWQWNDFNAGWESADSNCDYELSLVCRALGSHDADWLPPKDPAGSGHMPDFITYWFSLSAVVLGHLAWSNPALGMARWLNSGMPGDDGVLSGLKRLYGADAAALILNRNVSELATKMIHVVPNHLDQSEDTFDPSEALIHSPALVSRISRSRRWAAMLCGGSDPLQLADHLESLLLMPGPREVRLSGGSDAVSVPNVHLLLPNSSGWSKSLQRHGDKLPVRPDGRSWRVAVTSATLGYLGEFRRSRETGLWFAGRHASHMLGN